MVKIKVLKMKLLKKNLKNYIQVAYTAMKKMKY